MTAGSGRHVFKTRSLAKKQSKAGKSGGKSARETVKGLQINQTLQIRRGETTQTVVVSTVRAAGSNRRKRCETAESIELRESHRSSRRMERAGLAVPSGRPDKKDRRALAQLRDLDKVAAGSRGITPIYWNRTFMDHLYRFSFTNLPIRGQWVRLQSTLERRVNIGPIPLKSAAGPNARNGCYGRNNLKFSGAVAMQSQGNGAPRQSLAECRNHTNLRGIMHLTDDASFPQSNIMAATTTSARG